MFPDCPCAKTIDCVSSALSFSDNMNDVFSECRIGPPRNPSKIRRCSGGLTAANALRASNDESLKMKFPVPWYSCDPGFNTTSMRPRPGREYSAEYGSWLILICWMADTETFRLLISTPLTTSTTPLVPIALASRNRDIVARISWLKTGRFSIDVASTPDASRFDALSVLTSAATLPTVTSCVIPASGSVTRSGAGARLPTVTRTVVGWNPSNVTRRS